MRANTKIDARGRVVVPARFRKAMELAEGGEVLVRCEDGEVTLYTRAKAIRRAQALVARYTKGGKSSVDDFLDERRREAEREEAEDADATRLVRAARPPDATRNQ